MSNLSSVITDIYKISEIFKKNVNIPDYQRPYKWRAEHVRQLLNDLLNNFEHNERIYRLGTIVVHKNKGKFDIVDGQQRTITLVLLLKILGKKYKFLESKVEVLSAERILENHQIISDFVNNRIKERKSLFLNYILDKCEMVYVELATVEEAFQFFDSQNARGKKLAPYDLLKAYHLREMHDEDDSSIFRAVENWENAIESKDEKATLKMLINETLFKLRTWQLNNSNSSAESFRNEHIIMFKGVSKYAKYPYLRALIAGHAMYELKQANPFMLNEMFIKPAFQLNQALINGKYFFDYIEYYRKTYDFLFHPKTGYLNKKNIIASDKTLLDFLATYSGKHRIGDWYLLILFKCTIMMYFDKFGLEKLDEVVSLIFKWVYITRLKQTRITFRTIENKVIRDSEFMRIIAFAFEPNMVLQYSIKPLMTIEYKNADDLASVLRNMGMC